jgi:Cysteine-rich CPXCG
LIEESGFGAAVNDEASYLCGACGEEIVIPIDLSQGGLQEYVEDCPVCCRANVIRIEVDREGEIAAWAELE